MTAPLIAFARFWWDFLVGDTPEITAGVLAGVGGLSLLHLSAIAAAVLVPAGVVLLLGGSVYRGRKS